MIFFGAPKDRAAQEGIPEEVEVVGEQTQMESVEKLVAWDSYGESAPGNRISKCKGPGDRASWTVGEGVGIQ